MPRKKKRKNNYKKIVIISLIVILIIILILLVWCICFPKSAFAIFNVVTPCCILNNIVYDFFGLEPICKDFTETDFSDIFSYLSGESSSIGSVGGSISGGRASEYSDENPCRWTITGCEGGCGIGLECLSSGLLSCECQESEEDVTTTTIVEGDEVTTTTIYESEGVCDLFCEGYEYGISIDPLEPERHQDFFWCEDGGGDGFIENPECCCLNPTGGDFAEGYNDDAEKHGWCWDTDGGEIYDVYGVCFEGGELANPWETGDIWGDECGEYEGYIGLYEYWCGTEDNLFFGSCIMTFKFCDNCIDGECVETPTTTTTTTVIETTTTTITYTGVCDECDYEGCNEGFCKSIIDYITVCEPFSWNDLTHGFGKVESCRCRYYDDRADEYWIGDAEDFAPDGEKPCYLANDPADRFYCPMHKYMEGTCTNVGGDYVCLYNIPCVLSYPECDGYCTFDECSESLNLCNCGF